MPGHVSTSMAIPNIHGAKVMLCIWWDQLSVVSYELLKPSETITGDRYRTQLMRLSRALKKKRPQYQERHDKVILQHNNVRPHAARPIILYLFRSMVHGLAHQRFRSYEEIKKWIDSWIASKDASFFRDGIRQFPERCNKVLASDGQYFKS